MKRGMIVAGMILGLAGLMVYAGVSVTPLLIDLNIPPGGSYQGILTVQNTGKEPINIDSIVAGFYTKSNGVPAFLFGKEGETPYTYGGRGLLTIEPEHVVLQAGKLQNFTYTVKLPMDLDPFGGRYAAALFEATPVEEEEAKTGGSSIKVATRVVSMILMRPSEEIVVGAQMNEFDVQSEITNVNARLISNDAKLLVTTSFANNGNIHIRPEEFVGTITVTAPNGNVVKTLDIDPHIVLPDTTYSLKQVWPLLEDLTAGTYTIDVDISVTDPHDNVQTYHASTEMALGD